MAGGEMAGRNELGIPGDGAAARLKFIDLARSIAILLMLEGHFVDLVLDPVHRTGGDWRYVIWNSIRGFTAPLFFTVAGMIFVYLMTGEERIAFWRRQRVRKGLKRAAQLVFWGYALQLTLRNWPNYLAGRFEDWLFAFHVLQCIGFGLLALILLAGLQRLVPRVPLGWWYGLGLAATLWVYVWLRGLPEGVRVPEDGPQVLQNLLRGRFSVFPLAPWLAFAFLGGIMGSLVRRYRERLTTVASCAWFLGLAVLLKALWGTVEGLHVHGWVDWELTTVRGLSWFFGRASEVVLFLGVLRWVEIRWGIGLPWLLRVGKLTFPIYVLHVIVLYGGLFGYGLNRWWRQSFGPWEAAGGAFGFVVFFVVLAQGLDRYVEWRRAVKAVRATWSA